MQPEVTNTRTDRRKSTAMSDVSADIDVWFLRHGKTQFNYENSDYDAFIEMLCNGQDTPLLKAHGIDFRLLPKWVGFVGCSPAQRAVDTAEVVRARLGVKPIEKMQVLSEVKFDRDIILRSEFTSLAASRKAILQRWWEGKNRAESFDVSLARVREIESFLRERQEDSIILVTHGWFLRLLELYFVQRRRTDITLEEILAVKPVPLGHSLKATVARKGSVKERMDL